MECMYVCMYAFSSVLSMKNNAQGCSKCPTQEILLDQYQSRYKSISNFRFSNNTLVSINPDTTLSVFSGICLIRCSSIQNSRFITNTIVNINQDTTQSVLQGICPTRYNSIPLINTQGIRTIPINTQSLLNSQGIRTIPSNTNSSH